MKKQKIIDILPYLEFVCGLIFLWPWFDFEEDEHDPYDPY